MTRRPAGALVALTCAAILVASCSDYVPAPATPTPSASPRPPLNFPSLKLGPETGFPDDIALLLETGCFQCDGLATGLARVSRDASGVVRRELLVSAGAHVYYPDARTEQLYFAGTISIPRVSINTTKGVQPYDPSITGMAVSPDGSEIIVSACGYPSCNVSSDGWAPSGRASLYRSTDGGATWADYGAMVGGGLIGMLAPGRALAYRYTSALEITAFTAPDGAVIDRPESAGAVASPPFVLGDGTIAWANRTGELRRPDGSEILRLPRLPDVYRGYEIGWVAQQAFGSRLIAVGWSAKGTSFISVFTSEARPLQTVSSTHNLLYAAWASESVLAANIGIAANELVSETPRFFPGLLPAIIDLESREIRPITEYFLDHGAETGRNYVRGVQRLSADRTFERLPSRSPSPTSTTAAAVRDCLASDLNALLGSSNGLTMGQIVAWITIGNQSGTACTLYGTPGVTLRDETGSLVPIEVFAACAHARTYLPCEVEQAVVLVPGLGAIQPRSAVAGQAYIGLYWPSYGSEGPPCNPPISRAVEIRIKLSTRTDELLVATAPEFPEGIRPCHEIGVGWFEPVAGS